MIKMKYIINQHVRTKEIILHRNFEYDKTHFSQMGTCVLSWLIIWKKLFLRK